MPGIPPIFDPRRDLERDPQNPGLLNWQAHVAAGRIGANPPAPPAVVANRLRTAALFRDLAQERRRAEHDRLWDFRR